MSVLRTHRVAVVSGDGIVGRSMHGLLIAHGHPDAIDALLADRPLNTRDGVDALRVGVHDGLPDGIAGLVVVVEDDDDLEVTATGPEHVSVDGVEPPAQRRGQARIHRISGGGHVRLGVAIGRVGGAHDLREGVVPGAGVELIAAPAPRDAVPAAVETRVRTFDTRTSTVDDVALAADADTVAAEPRTVPAEPRTVPAEPRAVPEDAVAPPERAGAAPTDVEGPAPAPADVGKSAPARRATAEQAAPARDQAADLAPPERQAPVVAPAPPDPSRATGTALSATVPHTGHGEQRRGPVPTLGQQPNADAADPVDGILCARQHFNNPLARFCQVCGISMVNLTHNLVRRPRPTLGFIVFDDGTTFALDRSYLIGREPLDRSNTRLTPLVVVDDDHSVSRSHAELRLVDWQVVLRDLGSSNGTHVWDPQSSSWRRLPAGEQSPLDAGTYAAVGRRVFVYEPAVRS